MNFGKTIAIDGQNLNDVAVAADERLCLPGELEFLERLKAGDAEAFDELVTRYSADIYSLLVRLTEDAEEAKDLAQETFLSVVRSVKSFRGDASLKTWLYRIAINQARNRQRWWRSRRFGFTFSLDSTNEPDEQSLHETLADNSSQSPEDFTLQREQETMIRAALKKLPLAFREAVVLRDIEGLSYEEIAAALDTNIGTVKSRIARGREELKKKLNRSL
jgi:RNA polymerase sigma-70 factor (ECF subfamily)